MLDLITSFQKNVLSMQISTLNKWHISDMQVEIYQGELIM